jgi:uncharacterized protein
VIQSSRIIVGPFGSADGLGAGSQPHDRVFYMTALQNASIDKLPQSRGSPSASHPLTHVVGDQSAVFKFLSDPAVHGLSAPATGPQAVERIDTHGAAVFLAGKHAYKIKRAVCFPFMDFSTLARREEACRAEVEINRALAPEIYLDAIAITRDAQGQLAINGRGEPIEWAVAMNRFDPAMTFDRLVRIGQLSDGDLDQAVSAILAFQSRAPVRRASDWLADLGSYIEQNDQAFHEAHALFGAAQAATLTLKTTDEWQRMRALIAARGEASKVRRCHGDLHLRNIVRLPAGVRLFDAVEFDERIATGDVLYDLAFLLMDLDELGNRASANRVLNHYLMHSQDDRDLEALAALPLYLSIRAALRAKICAMSAAHIAGVDAAPMRDDAKRYFAYALDVLEPRDVSLTVVGGLSGVGKSAVTNQLASIVGRTPGALVLKSDVVRKSLAGVPWTQKLDASEYSAEMTGRVYKRLASMARSALCAGHSVIIDAVCADGEERDLFEGVARRAECHFAGVWLHAPLDTRLERIAARRGDASDADAAVARAQERFHLHDLEWPRVDADGGLADVVAAVRPLVNRLN